MVQLSLFCSPPPLLLPSPPPSFAAPLQATLDVVMNLQFHYIEKLWQTFWYSTPPSSDENTSISNRSEELRLEKDSDLTDYYYYYIIINIIVFLQYLSHSHLTSVEFHQAVISRWQFFHGCHFSLCSDDDMEGVIPQEKLVALCKYEPVRLWMRSCDHILYQALVEILIPDVLRPVPSQYHLFFSNVTTSKSPVL